MYVPITYDLIPAMDCAGMIFLFFLWGYVPAGMNYVIVVTTAI